MRGSNTTLTMLAGMTLAFAAQAAEPQPAETTDVTYAGVKVAIDARTGELRPLTAAESKRLSSAILKDSKAPVQNPLAGTQPRTQREAWATKRVAPDGAVRVRLPASLMTEMTATQGADGQIRISEGQAQAAGDSQ